MIKPVTKLVLSLTLLLILSLSNSCKVARFVGYNFADIKDYKKFPAREIARGQSHFQFYTSESGGVKPEYLHLKSGQYPFEDYLEKNNSVAFLVIRNDSILYENYWQKYDESSIVPSFSMAKSITSILIGCAIDDILIQSVKEPVTNYIPELIDEGFQKVAIEHLLQMTSGLKFNEGYMNPFGEVASFYYGRKLRKATIKLKLKTEPGQEFEYLSGNTQLLGLVLERALRGKSISQYMEEKLWQPLEMEYDATWSIDKKKDGIEKTFCCLNARARDFAKIGRLYLNNGKWNGKQIVSEDWVKQSTKVDNSFGSAWYYQYQWWLPTRNGDFMAQGILGQYIYVNPNKNLIIVRLGKNHGKADWWEVFIKLAEQY